MTENELQKFLRKRGVSEDVLVRLEEDKIDTTVIGLLSDKKLENYLPKFGDRIAVVAFAKSMENRSPNEEDREDTPSPNRKRSLIERITMKVKKDKNMQREYLTRSKSQIGNKNAKRIDKRVEIGWLDFDPPSLKFKQVKEPGGGGTRHESYRVDTTLKQIFPDALNCFFPSGNSRRGDANEFDFFMTDSTHENMDENTTVEEMYKRKKCKILRLYIAGKKRIHRGMHVSPSRPTSSTGSALSSDESPGELPELGNLFQIPEEESATQNLIIQEQTATSLPRSATITDLSPSCTNSELYACSSANDSLFREKTDMTTVQESNMLFYVPVTFEQGLVQTMMNNSEVSEVFNGPTQDGSLPSSPRSPTPPVKDAAVVTIHRTQIQQEMLNMFMDPDIVTTPIKMCFVDEAGTDATGVSRDAYSAFWKEFFVTSACGENERVPVIFPNYGKDEWEAVGRILLKGYIDAAVFPLQLSYAFAVAVINGEQEVTPDILLKSLRAYLCESDRKVLDKALDGQILDEDDQDDFLDLLSRVDCHTIPEPDEVKQVVLSIAHKELIQEPKYALDAIGSTCRKELQDLLPNAEAILNMYESKKPSVRKVIHMMKADPVDKEQASVFSYLKQFIKGLDDTMLKKFLRYVTGAEVLCTNSIEVSFNQMRGFGPLLELPSTYNSYPELRKELLSILDANYLNMDIV